MLHIYTSASERHLNVEVVDFDDCNEAAHLCGGKSKSKAPRTWKQPSSTLWQTVQRVHEDYDDNVLAKGQQGAA